MGAATATVEAGRAGPPGRAGVPWYLWCSALAVTSAYVGGYWDISWHRSIGRDTFWSAPHIAIYACGVLAGIVVGVPDFHDHLRQRSRRCATSASASGGCAGRSAPSSRPGAASRCWSSAPFDDWWHNAYGLDVKIISPPHMVLAAGFFGIEFGTIMLLLAFMNRAAAAYARAAAVAVSLRRRHGGRASRCCSSWNTSAAPTCTRALFYIVVAIGTPAIADRARRRVAAPLGVHDHGRRSTRAFALAFLWILPLFPARAEARAGAITR